MRKRFFGRLVCAAVMTATLSAAIFVLSAGEALALNPAPALSATTLSLPTVFSPSHTATCLQTFSCDEYVVIVHNAGAAATEGEITITDELPGGVSVVEIEHENSGPLSCEAGPPVKCVYSESLPAHGYIKFEVKLTVEPSAPSSLENKVSVTGGGSAPASATDTTPVGEQTPEFGFDGAGGNFSFETHGAAGAADLLAGDHPNEVSVNVQVPSTFQPGAAQGTAVPVENVKNLVFYLPLGFLGDPQAGPKCPSSLLVGPEESSLCPPASQVGQVVPNFFSAVGLAAGVPTHAYPVFNMVPEKGYPAQFAFRYLTLRVNMYVSVVRRDGAYRLKVYVSGLPRSKFRGILASFFGSLSERYKTGELETTREVGAFLTNPSACSEQNLSARVEADTWENPQHWVSQSTVVYPQLEDCNLLSLPAEFSVRPETTQADEPSGYAIGLRVAQAPNQSPNLGTPPLKDVTVTLAPGVSISPGGADGLQACQLTGANGINLDAEAIGADGQGHAEPGHCPAASEVATVSVTSPDLAEPLNGHLYVAQPECAVAGKAPCQNADAENGDLFRLYLEVEAKEAGVVLKLPGFVSANTTTGQLTASFKDNPQFPLSELTVHTLGGPRATLANPQTCGPATTVGDFSPWGAPLAADAFTSSTFVVDQDGAGAGCPALGFSPSFTAGTVVPTAGAYSPVTLTLSRQDREANLSTISTLLPAGLLATISHVPECADAQAQAGTCAEASRVGSVVVSAGSGSRPYYGSGKAYLTAPYKGAPFGLSVVVPAVAGPFNLGTVVVRVALYVDPNDAHVTAVSDPLPQMLLGVPLRVRTINVTLDRPEFTFNPTNCEQKQVAASIAGVNAHGAAVGSMQASSPFAVAGCKNLSFNPRFSARTSSQVSKADGASLDVNVAYAPGDANIRAVAVSLPKQLPSRLTTIQKACDEHIFAANPASCPEGSLVGMATANTPVLSVPLEGPAYLVSHGGRAFPDLVMVLQGQGVTVDLVGAINISKGITSSTFSAVPDAPISNFKLSLPRGPHSALTAIGGTCTQPLVMPTTLTGQNGATLKQQTLIRPVGCPVSVKLTRHRVTKTRLSLSVAVTEAGSVTVTGANVRRVKRSVGRGTFTISAVLSKAGRARVRHRWRLGVKIKLSSGKVTKTIDARFKT